ncbi:GIY-YIG nuclease family protein [Candidatus Parcubacteria bacterium]|nr:MAG: GIY-YIG nuclease family protein [Candidatus Parcubacteria bacterium]
MFFVYVLYSEKIHRFYIGQTGNLHKRIDSHNNGLSHWSKRGVPWKLIYQEKYLTRSQAMIREKFLKTGAGRDFIYEVTKNNIRITV